MGDQRLDVFKALGDNTRYAIYLELARASRPLATAEIADGLDLHVNTVRPHLERMRELGLLAMEVDPRGGVGRPQHRYGLSPDAPSLGLEPPAYPLLAAMLVRASAEVRLDPEEVTEAGREQGRVDGARARAADLPCQRALELRLAELGFDPASTESDDNGDESTAGTTIAFTHCPFRQLAEVNPDLVCGLHRGMVEGLIELYDDADVADFRSLIDRDPCQVDIRIPAR